MSALRVIEFPERETSKEIAGRDPREEEYFILCTNAVPVPDYCLFWKPKACGYTCSVELAGRYSYEEALPHHRPGEGHHMVPCHVVESRVTLVVSHDRHGLELLNASSSVPKPVRKSQ
jgi:hypothetical protein